MGPKNSAWHRIEDIGASTRKSDFVGRATNTTTPPLPSQYCYVKSYSCEILKTKLEDKTRSEYCHSGYLVGCRREAAGERMPPLRLRSCYPHRGSCGSTLPTASGRQLSIYLPVRCPFPDNVLSKTCLYLNALYSLPAEKEPPHPPRCVL